MYVDERKIIYSGKDITDDELKIIVKKYGGESSGYMICWDERYDSMDMTVDSGIYVMREDGMCMIFVLGNICIISTEQTQGAKEIFILHDAIEKQKGVR